MKGWNFKLLLWVTHNIVIEGPGLTHRRSCMTLAAASVRASLSPFRCMPPPLPPWNACCRDVPRALTMGLVSVGYAAMATAAAIAAAAFGSLVPGTTVASGSSPVGANATAAAVAAVDWVDVALRTAVGLTADIGADGSGVAGRVQVLTALQEAGSGPLAAWAVTSVLPGLCALAIDCKAAVAAVRMGALRPSVLLPPSALPWPSISYTNY
ncbi:hypothetical protein Vretimale_8172 [Volvox reticuliferus]|uniref:Uncharacterized protein n=1 Tax=Volvox reticuliferus TaxID=1737510 RepID=A0A8J4GB53_9CHLO|nr:hypothetical protein Vretimale_8172 [Volvox reticuliferus]